MAGGPQSSSIFGRMARTRVVFTMRLHAARLRTRSSTHCPNAARTSPRCTLREHRGLLPTIARNPPSGLCRKKAIPSIAGASPLMGGEEAVARTRWTRSAHSCDDGLDLALLPLRSHVPFLWRAHPPRITRPHPRRYHGAGSARRGAPEQRRCRPVRRVSYFWISRRIPGSGRFFEAKPARHAVGHGSPKASLGRVIPLNGSLFEARLGASHAVAWFARGTAWASHAVGWPALCHALGPPAT